ncbi:hypothetical protein GCM10023322_09720 [Rugosimonospora acidiphila]|uniref:Secreted protein n=1 Tax=Rugosimonospora acidiphila TaxID=556531 RepID=A0ABP9RKI2_9ACTN
MSVGFTPEGLVVAAAIAARAPPTVAARTGARSGLWACACEAAPTGFPVVATGLADEAVAGTSTVAVATATIASTIFVRMHTPIIV